MRDVCARGRPALALFNRLAAALVFLALGAPVFAAAPITVQIDRARLIKLPEPAATVVIGNPLIADLSIQPGGLAVVTGKGYGSTNVIVLDRNGAVLAEHTLEVVGPSDPTVVVYRGVDRETYSCTPECSPRITLGDGSEYFNATLNQTTTRDSQAMAAGSHPTDAVGGPNGAAGAPAPSSSYGHPTPAPAPPAK